MAIQLLTSQENLKTYDSWIRSHPYGSLWQSLEWKTYQEALGREVRVYVEGRRQKAEGSIEATDIVASALVVVDRTTGGLSTWDAPRGPLWGDTRQQMPDARHEKTEVRTLLETILADAKNDRCLSFYLSPPLPLETGNWKLETSSRHEQPEATRILDLTLSEEELLAQMHQKGRYNIKVAQKNGVIIEQSRDIDSYAALAEATYARDGFRGASKRQYEAFLNHLPGSFLLLAYKTPDTRHQTTEKKPLGSGVWNLESHISPIAGLLGVIWNHQAYYYYGASDYAHRALMAPYLLQWEAMKHCKAKGCTVYDLLGIAPPDRDASAQLPDARKEATGNWKLETGNSSHPWAGISSFKEKFGGTVISYPPEQQIVLKPMISALLKWKRKILG